jgi:hypothetical protein
MMLYFCAIDTDRYYTDCNTSTIFRCLCLQMWYRRRPEDAPAMQKLAQIVPMNRDLHFGPHKEPPNTSRKFETKTVIRYQIPKPSSNIMWPWHAQYSYRWSQRRHMHLKHTVTHDSHKAKTAAVIQRSVEISTLKDRGTWHGPNEEPPSHATLRHLSFTEDGNLDHTKEALHMVCDTSSYPYNITS